MSDADRYQFKNELEHILDRPGMYIGPTEFIETEMYISDMEDETKIVKKKMMHSAGLQRIYEEILLNAFDQTVREGTGCNEIRVDVNQETGTISVENNGEGIPVLIKEELGCYIPEMVFGRLRTSSNYSNDEKRITGGCNGVGSSLTLIFSDTFLVETIDSIRKKSYSQTWNGFESCTAPIIKKSSRKPMTRITFRPNLKYFDIDSISDDGVMLMKKRLIDIGFASHSGVKTYWNDKLISIKKPDDYMKLYRHPEGEKFIVDTGNDRWVVGVVLSHDGFQHSSFVNGIHTSIGGSHVDHVANQIAKGIIDKLKAKKIEVKLADVKNKMFVFIKSAIENPVFDSQTKDCMKMPKSKFGSEYVMSEAFRKKIVASSILKSMTAVSDAKKMKDLEKTSGVKTSRLTDMDTLEDATWAGTARALKTKLILTEGLSARTFAISALNVIGRNEYGVFPLKGKLLNVRKASITKVSKNEEITNIVKILGLRYELKYETPAEMNTLRYGGVIALADSDFDGIHITGLIINFFHYFWPNLITNGFVSFCITPIVKVFKGKETLEFYTLNSYEEWLKSAKGAYKTKYFKGLGTSTAAEARDALKNIDSKLIRFERDGLCDEFISLAFNENRANDRKNWLMDSYNPDSNIDRHRREVGVSDFINYELIHFSTYDCERSIPSIVDGFKTSQRKIMFVSLKYIQKNEMKVGQLGPKVSELTDYHHGEQSLMDAIIGMAQDFVGTNNINLLEPLGAFGSRLCSGNDAASPRYIFTKLNATALKIFDRRDNCLLEYLDSDGTSIEPEWYIPMLPMILVNGALGIGTGFSTSVPQYNPKDIIKYLISMLKGKTSAKDMLPWYRGFTGVIEKVDANKFISYGVWEFDDKKKCLHITELPLKSWTDNYKSFCEKMLAAKDSPLVDVIYGNTDVVVDFKIMFKKDSYDHFKNMDEDLFIKTFNLSSTLHSTNMYLLNAEGRIQKYNSVYEIIDYYYSIRLEYYIKRKQAMIEQLRYEMLILSNKAKFISFVKDGKIDQKVMTEKSLTAALQKDFDVDPRSTSQSDLGKYEYLVDMGYRSFTNENKKKMQEAVKAKEIELKELERTSPEQMWITDLKEVSALLD